MNYHLHENGWTVILDNVDLKTIGQEEVNQISKLLSTNTCVVVKNQFLTVTEELRVINMFKNPEPLYKPADFDFIQSAADLTQDPAGVICRVSGALNDHGMEGIAGYVDEMTWHCNHPYRADRRPLVWLYGVKGTEGSRTSWNNNIMTYRDLDQGMKDLLDDVKIIAKKGMNHCARLDAEEGGGEAVEDFTPNIVHTNIAGLKGLYFPFLQIDRFKDWSVEESQKIIKPLAEFTTQEKYCYHHDWEDGDLVLSEQWLGIHKRWRFEGIKNRLVHRAVMDFPDQNYQ